MRSIYVASMAIAVLLFAPAVLMGYRLRTLTLASVVTFVAWEATRSPRHRG
jgi:hypothetical protein